MCTSAPKRWLHVGNSRCWRVAAFLGRRPPPTHGNSSLSVPSAPTTTTQDLLVASLFRNFLLAERIMTAAGCSPVSYPRLPPTHHHPLWQVGGDAPHTLCSRRSQRNYKLAVCSAHGSRRCKIFAKSLLFTPFSHAPPSAVAGTGAPCAAGIPCQPSTQATQIRSQQQRSWPPACRSLALPSHTTHGLHVL